MSKMSKRSIRKAKRGATGKASRSSRRATNRLDSRIMAFEKATGGASKSSINTTGYTRPGAIDRHC